MIQFKAQSQFSILPEELNLDLKLSLEQKYFIKGTGIGNIRLQCSGGCLLSLCVSQWFVKSMFHIGKSMSQIKIRERFKERDANGMSEREQNRSYISKNTERLLLLNNQLVRNFRNSLL